MNAALAFWVGVFTLWALQQLYYLLQKDVRKEAKNDKGVLRGSARMHRRTNTKV